MWSSQHFSREMVWTGREKQQGDIPNVIRFKPQLQPGDRHIGTESDRTKQNESPENCNPALFLPTTCLKGTIDKVVREVADEIDRDYSLVLNEMSEEFGRSKIAMQDQIDYLNIQLTQSRSEIYSLEAQMVNSALRSPKIRGTNQEFIMYPDLSSEEHFDEKSYLNELYMSLTDFNAKDRVRRGVFRRFLIRSNMLSSEMVIADFEVIFVKHIGNRRYVDLTEFERILQEISSRLYKSHQQNNGKFLNGNSCTH